ncbi:PhoX family phosphatase [Ramlibacter solisilvae]|uniref:Phosphatase n=1 Tax=Ramlibacter tataouinensis TaxID=94132 RepID=A0A127JQW4_9BURK|nr:PhoX family phosphatase [Ramlibacter tataouinensis]AMO22428.1 phosphatase [Ramlibacter tataouinensis]
MKEATQVQLAHAEEDCNRSDNPSLMDVLEARLSRRSALRVGIGSAGAVVLGALPLAGCGGSDAAAAAPTLPETPKTPISLGFQAVAKSTADLLTVPAGYTATVLYALGDPLTSATPEFRNDGTDANFADRAGDHHDGMEFFPLNDAGTARDLAGSSRGILAMNHEATTDQFLHAAGVTVNPRPAAEADKEVDVHGLSFVEVRKTGGKFGYVKDSAHNRRVTPLTPILLNGPVRSNALVKTKYSPAGTSTRGTINNCGASPTPWGTYFSGEENWNGYFTRGAADDAARGGATARSVVSLVRYGKAQGAASRHGWETAGADDKYARWNISAAGAAAEGTDDYRNEMNTYGYMVEVDPYDKSQAIRKRTALGRFAHELGVFGRQVAGKPLAVYMGDDSRGEYIYKFVSSATWSEADANPANRITTGDKYLDTGKLYVAKFNADGSGDWVELDIGNPTIASYTGYRFADQADVLVNARLAADAVGATKMDRPEWCAVHPSTGEIYFTLTNNSNRRVEPVGSSQHGVDAANPRSYTDAPSAPSTPGNINGHILRLRETGNEGAATGFNWDIYLFGAESGMDAARINLSSLTADNDFSSPDGLWFSKKTGLLFIQTDDGAYTDVTNCMMLVGKAGTLGDGSAQTINYTKADGSTLAVQTRVGAKPTAATLRRFLVGPKDCEITGITETPDGRAIFVNIQHPGETIAKANIADPSKYLSHWPGNTGYGSGGNTARPRSATIVITRNDGGLVAADGNEVLNTY